MSGRAAAGDGSARLLGERFAAAHRALADDPAVQYRLVRPPAAPETPAWLRALGDWLRWALRPLVDAIRRLFSWLPDWPWARIVLWSAVGAAAALALWLIVERVRHGEWRVPQLPRRRPASPAAVIEHEPPFAPAPARAWLREADALAALGRFAEAAHLLLFRSVEDLARRRPGAVRPALTSRELAAATAFPPAARACFAGIAALVERSLFGGRAVEASDWRAARAAYAELALPRAWRT